MTTESQQILDFQARVADHEKHVADFLVRVEDHETRTRKA